MLSTGCCDWLFCLFFTSCLGWLTGYHWKESYWSVCLSYTYYHVHLLSGPDQSLLEEYEQRVQERQGELEALRKQREDLLNLEAMLQDLLITQVRLIMFQFWVLIFWFWVQRIMTCFLFSKQEQEKESSSKAAQQPPSDKREKIMAELERQQQLKEELIKKSHRLQQLKGVSVCVWEVVVSLCERLLWVCVRGCCESVWEVAVSLCERLLWVCVWEESVCASVYH